MLPRHGCPVELSALWNGEAAAPPAPSSIQAALLLVSSKGLPEKGGMWWLLMGQPLLPLVLSKGLLGKWGSASRNFFTIVTLQGIAGEVVACMLTRGIPKGCTHGLYACCRRPKVRSGLLGPPCHSPLLPTWPGWPSQESRWPVWPQKTSEAGDFALGATC